MNFILSDRVAIIANDRNYTYATLNADVDARAGHLLEAASKLLVLLHFANDYPSVVNYLAARRAGAATLIIAADLPKPLLSEITQRFRPDVELSSDQPAV